jgi:rod shape-determining protein MreC
MSAVHLAGLTDDRTNYSQCCLLCPYFCELSLPDWIKNNPARLLLLLLAIHAFVILINRVPGQQDKRYLQTVALAIITPVQSVSTSLISALRNNWNNYFSLRDARQENTWLRQENARLQNVVTHQQDDLRRLEGLTRLQDWQKTQQYASIPARVVGRDANRWFNTIIINRGTESGISEGNPVVTTEGLVGRVIVASLNSAMVMLLTDEKHGTGAVIGQLVDTRVLGSIQGKGTSLCRLDIVAGEFTSQPGEPVMTSGQDGIYPAGLLIGRVSRVDAIATAGIEITPAAPLARLEFVSVLLISREEIRATMEAIRRTEQERLEKEKQAKADALPKKSQP